MKKLSGMICVLILTLSFSACTPSEPADAPPSTETSAATSAPAETQSEPTTVVPEAEDKYADLSHLTQTKLHFFLKLGFTPSSLHTALADGRFLSTAHRGVVSVYTGDLFGNDKKKAAIVVTLLDNGGMDHIQANYFYSGDGGLATEVLLSATLDYTYHPGHSDPPTLFLYRHGGKTYFCTQYTGGNEYGGGSWAHYGLVYSEILPGGKTAAPISLEYGHHAMQLWYARVYRGDEVLSSSEDVYDDDGGFEEEASFDAINEKLKEIGLFSESAVGGYFGDRTNDTSGNHVVHLKDINAKTPGVTMLVSGSVDGGWGHGIGTVEYTDHVRYE